MSPPRPRPYIASPPSTPSLDASGLALNLIARPIAWTRPVAYPQLTIDGGVAAAPFPLPPRRMEGCNNCPPPAPQRSPQTPTTPNRSPSSLTKLRPCLLPRLTQHAPSLTASPSSTADYLTLTSPLQLSRRPTDIHHSRLHSTYRRCPKGQGWNSPPHPPYSVPRHPHPLRHA